ncbi:uncharacterized protein GGS22DRAFT_193406 [Annulohypoxylon maeteangense]|uniref:uncharacterized protein n=1 Tax=Annulohypoxylon maeteangense TaxID=1927788 RepID=UPI002008BC7F|nr:uncharacterized protein GGS22DRAFT_193406 [Annulohypoxylon maeteangense]KAI0880344.1 hypothetical protein GGS22DRAFT_193406 [Annulohypoxylon maeteangense]
MPLLRKKSPENGTKTKILRRLGNSEKYQLAMYLLDHYRGTIVSCRYRLPYPFPFILQRKDLINMIHTAIAIAILRNRILQVGVANADSNAPRWVQLESVRLSNHIEFGFFDENDEDISKALDAMIVHELDAKFPELDKRPGWRVIVLWQQGIYFVELIFIFSRFHHDGMSGKVFHQNILEYLNNQNGPNAHHARQFIDGDILKLPKSSLRLPPPIEKVTKFSITPIFAIKTLWQELKPSIFHREASLAKWVPIQSTPSKTNIRTFTIEAPEVLKIRTACREHKTSIAGLLHGLMLASLASHLHEETAKAFKSITAINLRPLIPSSPSFEADQAMANYTTHMSHTFDEELVREMRPTLDLSIEGYPPLPPDALDQVWLVSAQVQREIQRKLDRGMKNDNVRLMRWIPDWKKQISRAARRPRVYSWFVNNVGEVDGRTFGTPWDGGGIQTWNIIRSQFVMSAKVNSAAFVISLVTTKGEELCVSGSWQECVMDDKLAHGVICDLETWLNQIASEEP